jgi:arylsulfatase A-like enzyme
MAHEGMLLTDLHSNSSVCSPIRAEFVTGRYQQHVGIVDVIIGPHETKQGLSPSTTTVVEVFKKHA